MKKILIALVVVIASVALLPIVGNSVAEKVLKTKVAILTSNGLEIRNETTILGYLKTKKHYKFVVSDGYAFGEYLNQHSTAQLPPYVDAMIKGSVVGVDIEYSNFPFSSKVLVDIYPLSLSASMMQELEKEDVKFYTYLKNLLESKGVLYHINYNISDKSFDGYIKDIDEEYIFDNGTKVTYKIKDATYVGEGSLLAPKKLQAYISDVNVEVNASEKAFIFNIHDLSSISNFQSQSSYATSAEIKTFSLFINDIVSGKTEFSMDDIKMNFSSDTEGKKARFHSKSSFEKLKVKSQFSNIVAYNFNYDISFDGVDKDAYEELNKLTSNIKSEYLPEFEQALQASIGKILSRGLTLSIADLSLKKMGVNAKDTIDGFSIKVKLTLKEDANLTQELKSSPTAWVENMDLTSSLKFSKKFFSLINKEFPITILAKGLVREKNNNFIFDIKLDAGRLSINAKEIN